MALPCPKLLLELTSHKLLLGLPVTVSWQDMDTLWTPLGLSPLCFSLHSIHQQTLSTPPQIFRVWPFTSPPALPATKAPLLPEVPEVGSCHSFAENPWLLSSSLSLKAHPPCDLQVLGDLQGYPSPFSPLSSHSPSRLTDRLSASTVPSSRPRPKGCLLQRPDI